MGGKVRKLAIVTGASSGVGASAARRLAERGYRVILVARRAAELEQEAARIGAGAVAEPCDAASGEQVLALADRVGRDHGVPHVIVHSAGAGMWKYVEETSPAEAVAMMGAPYLAAFNVTHAFIAAMIARRSGVIIHVNSPAAFFPWPGAAGYTASRWALRGLHEALCQDLAGTGVRSCHLVLGRVDSPYFDHNPGTNDRLPGIARTIRSLSTDECGLLIARLAEHPRREVFAPLMLRLYAWTHRLAPPVVRAALRWTGARREPATTGADR